jgi:DNA-binding transcriptional MerR regulator
MLPEHDTLDLIALADAAGVTPRTVRYYVQQGLLPSPNKRGPGTKYGQPLLDRLKLIKLLQRRHLPLTEIRAQLDTLDDDGIRQALGADPELSLGDPNVGYVRSLLYRSEPTQRAREAGAAVNASAAAYAGDLFPESRNPKSTWERIRLSRDVELHIRRPLTRERNKLVDRLLDAAKDIFAEEP